MELNLTYVDIGGLYLIPDQMQEQGRITDICIYGYTRSEYIRLYQLPNGDFNMNSDVRNFAYAMLYRPQNDEEQTLSLVYKPVVVYHGLSVTCVSASDGLEWNVEKGDRVGVYIPSDCITPDELLSGDTIDTFNEEELRQFSQLCPSQVNLNRPEECSYAHYLNATLGIDEINSIEVNQVINASSTRLNIKVTMEGTYPTDPQSFDYYSYLRSWLLSVGAYDTGQQQNRRLTQNRPNTEQALNIRI